SNLQIFLRSKPGDEEPQMLASLEAGDLESIQLSLMQFHPKRLDGLTRTFTWIRFTLFPSQDHGYEAVGLLQNQVCKWPTLDLAFVSSSQEIAVRSIHLQLVCDTGVAFTKQLSDRLLAQGAFRKPVIDGTLHMIAKSNLQNLHRLL